MSANEDTNREGVVIKLAGHMVYNLGAAIDAWPKFTASANAFGLVADQAVSTDHAMGRLSHEIRNMISSYLYLYTLQESRKHWTNMERSVLQEDDDASRADDLTLNFEFRRYRSLNPNVDGWAALSGLANSLESTNKILWFHAIHKSRLCAATTGIFGSDDIRQKRKVFEDQLRIATRFQVDIGHDLQPNIYATIQQSVREEDPSLTINPSSVLWLGDYFLEPEKKTIISKECEDRFKAGLAKLGLVPSAPRLVQGAPYAEKSPASHNRSSSSLFIRWSDDQESEV